MKKGRKKFKNVPWLGLNPHRWNVKLNWLEYFCKFVKRGVWQSTFLLFMRAKNLSNVPFVITNIHKSGFWLNTLHQFTRARNYSNVPFVVTALQIRVIWLVIWPQFIKTRNHFILCYICDYNYSQRASLSKHMASVHEDKKSYNCSFFWLNIFTKMQPDQT